MYQKTSLHPMAAPSDINPTTGKALAINPSTGNWDDNYFAKTYGGGSSSSGSSGSGSTSGLNTSSILDQAKQVNQFYKEQNQPVIAATEATKAPLAKRYSDLLASIKGNQQVAENRQTLTTNNELGKRGITGSSGVAQQEITNAVNPITQQYTGMAKDTTNQQNMDMANIDAAIAKLQAGNPESSVSTASGIQNAITQANQFQQTLEATQKQRDIENAIAKLKSESGGNQYMTVGEGSTVFDPVTGRPLYTAPKTYAPGTGEAPNPYATQSQSTQPRYTVVR